MTKASSQAQNGFLESVALKEGTWASDLLDRGAGQGPSLSSPAPPRWADCSLGQILSLTSRASFFPICKIGHLIPVGGHELVQIFRKSIQPTGAIKKLRQRFRSRRQHHLSYSSKSSKQPSTQVEAFTNVENLVGEVLKDQIKRIKYDSQGTNSCV